MLPKTQRHRKIPRTSEPKRKSGTRAAIRASRKTLVNTADASAEQEEILPHPATFANQMETSVIHRLLESGHKSYMLTQNWRQHGMAGEFFNKQFYNNTIKFHQAREKYSLIDKAAINWLQSSSGKDDTNENTLMINMNSFENCEARSFNVGNVNFVLEKLIDLLSDPNFFSTGKNGNDAKVLIVAPYQAQRSLYMHELQKRASWDVNNKGKWVPFDKSRVEIRTQRSPSSASSSTTERSSSTSGSGAMNGAQRSSVLSSSGELINLLADPQFTKTTSKGLEADVMIIAPYEAQRNLYEYELQRRASLELNSKGDWVRFDKSRIKIWTQRSPGARGKRGHHRPHPLGLTWLDR